MHKPIVFFLCLMGMGTPIWAQDSATQSLIPAAAENAVAAYNASVDHQARLYNGIEHYGYYIRIKGFAYFNEPVVQKGSIEYDGLVYNNISMWYDLVKDQVIILHFNNFTRVGLVSEKVKEFTVLNHHFIRLQFDSTSQTPLTTGFYDELYKGSSTVLAKRVKVINEIVKDEIEREFMQHNLYCIQKDSTYYIVKNYKGLLSVFKYRAKEIKQYLRKNKIRYRKEPENALVKAAAYYDSLMK